MILIPKYTDMYMDKPIVGGTNQCEGFFRVRKYNSMGQVNHDTGWFHNMWLNQGLDFWGTQSDGIFDHMSVGTGTTAVDYTDTQLSGTYLGYRTTNYAASNSVLNAPTYGQYQTFTRRFSAGNGTGTIGEIGLSHVAGNPGTNLSIRALLPTPVTKAADETLDITYRWYQYPYLGDVFGTITVNGELYNYQMRQSNVDDTGNRDPLNRPRMYLIFNGDSYAMGDGGALGSVTGAPSGGSTDGGDTSSEVWRTYFNGNHYRDQYINIPLDGYNTGSGIRCVVVKARMYAYQVRFGHVDDDSTIPKDNTKIIEEFELRFSWSRRETGKLAGTVGRYDLTGVDPTLTYTP